MTDNWMTSRLGQTWRVTTATRQPERLALVRLYRPHLGTIRVLTHRPATHLNHFFVTKAAKFDPISHSAALSEVLRDGRALH
jgi:hypothetical protein